MWGYRMLRQVTLHGPLAARFGDQPITLDADDVQMLFSGLDCAHPGFMRELRNYPKLAIGLKDGEDISFISEQRMGWNFGSKPEVHLACAEEGSIEAAAVAVAEWAAGGTWATVAGVDAAIYATAYVATIVAISYAIGTVARSMAEKPSGTGAGKEEVSALFDGPVNLEGQGHPIPLVYGEFRCGTVVISADVISEKQAIAVGDVANGVPNTPVTGNVFANDIDGDTMTLTNFSVGSTTYSPGATATITNGTVNIASNGNYTVTSTVDQDIEIVYLCSSATTAKTSGKLFVKFLTPAGAYDGGNGMGPGGGQGDNSGPGG